MTNPTTIELNLSVYETKILLDELSDLLEIANRDNTMTAVLYEKIAEQFYGIPVKVTIHNKKENK